MIVVDSSVLVDFFRKRLTGQVKRFKELERDSIPYAIPVVCCREVLQGARDEREWKLLRSYLGGQDLLVSTDDWSTHLESARIFFDCRRKGITLRSSVDCFVAQLVLENDDVLLHSDDDFEKIKEVRPLRTLVE